jgi:hypothetical protein
MAIGISLLLSEFASAGGGNFTTSSVTPPNNCLLVVVIHAMADITTQTVAGVTLSDSTTLTWTKRTSASAFCTGASGYQTGLVVFTAPVTTGASTVLSIGGFQTASNVWYTAIYAITGHNTGTPVGAMAINNNNTSLTPSFSLSASPASSSLVMSFTSTVVSSGTTGVTQGSGFTLGYTLGASGFMAAGGQYRTGTTSATIAWAGIDDGDSGIWGGTNSVQTGIEFLEAGGGEVVTMDKWWQAPAYLKPKNQIVGY